MAETVRHARGIGDPCWLGCFALWPVEPTPVKKSRYPWRDRVTAETGEEGAWHWEQVSVRMPAWLRLVAPLLGAGQRVSADQIHGRGLDSSLEVLFDPAPAVNSVKSLALSKDRLG